MTTLDSSPVQKKAFSRIQHKPEKATVPLHVEAQRKELAKLIIVGKKSKEQNRAR